MAQFADRDLGAAVQALHLFRSRGYVFQRAIAGLFAVDEMSTRTGSVRMAAVIATLIGLSSARSRLKNPARFGLPRTATTAVI